MGPVSPSGHTIRYGMIEDVREALAADGHRIAAILLEPIQGSAGYGFLSPLDASTLF